MASLETSSERRVENYIATLDSYEREQYMPEYGVLGDFSWATRHVVWSRPVDLDQVTARLLELPEDRNTGPRPYVHGPSDEGSPAKRSANSDATLTPPSNKELERRGYDELVSDGGRPLYPIHLLDDVARNPGAHQEMLQAWLNHPDRDAKHPCWEVFGEQLYSWKCFRKWQTYNREGGGSLYKIGGKTAYEIFFYYFRRRSPTYTEAVQNLLAQYNFTRPIQLNDDPKRQDKLATWIEYLAFTCSIHYRYTCLIKHLQPEFDEAWGALLLLHSNLLRPSDTKENICNIKSAITRRKEREEAQRATYLAQGALGLKQTPKTNRLAAQSTLYEAKESMETIARRDEVIMDFNITVQEYKKAKNSAERCNRRVQWIMEQVSIIEAETNESAVLETKPNPIRGTKRRYDQESMDTVNQSIKKRRENTDKQSSRAASNGDNIVPHDDKNNSDKRESDQSSASSIKGPHNTRRTVRNLELSRIATKSSDSPLLRNNNTKRAQQISATAAPLRRSARIAARKQF
ncbi:hypothetical protein GGR51DRAFT_576310 [Nemania sp. FL0031]|nr:hypothetical protein GGR51DRAFT_576310 [Nemania sp. FL0031]